MGLPKEKWDNESKVFPLYMQSALMSWLCFQGANFEDLVLGTELEEEDFANPDKKIDYNTLSTLVSNGSRYWGKPGLGLSFGKKLTLGFTGPVGQVGLAAPTPRSACEYYLKYRHLRSAILDVRFQQTKDSLTFIYECVTPEASEQRFFIDTGMSGTVKYLSILLGANINVCGTLKDDGGGYADQYNAIFSKNVDFNSNFNSVTLFSNCLDDPSMFADTMIFAEANGICEDYLDNNTVRLSISQSVLLSLKTNMVNPPTLPEIALELGLSARSLRRHLARQGTSYRDCLNNIKSQRAKELLRDPNMTISHISDMLEYDSPANFNRAFKKWFGKTPSEFRLLEM